MMAAEYILKEGNEKVLLCERGIRTFETAYRFTLDLTAVPVLKEMTHLPIVVDPSHAAGRRDLVEPLSLAAAAAGADGIIVETHPKPDEAICDGPQALRVDEFAAYAAKVEQAAMLAGKLPFGAAAGHGEAQTACSRRRRRHRAHRRLGRPGRPRAAGRARRRHRPQGAAAAWSAARSTRPAPTSRGRSTAPTSRSSPRPSTRCRRSSRDVLAAAPAGCVVTDVGSTKRALVEAARGRALRRRPSAGRRRGRRRRARARRPVRRRHLVPDAAPTTSGVLLERLHRFAHRARRASRRSSTGRPRPPDGRRLAPAARARQRARRAGRRRAGRRAAARRRARASATPRASPAPTRQLWTGIYSANRDALCAALDGAIARLTEVRAALAGDDRDALLGLADEAAADRRRALLEAGLAGGPVRELRVAVPNRPGVIADIALDARPRGHQHPRHGLAPVAGHPQRRGRAVGRRATRPTRRASWSRRSGSPSREASASSPRAAARRRSTPPADKSISHRAALLGAMAAEPVRIRNYLHADGHALDARAPSRALGALVELRAGRARRSAAPACATPPSPTGRSTSATPAR